ncbi:MAG: uroporphyrinogen decarboxylase [Gammaproteobacteria bacterium]|nr:uroporphyrinogen decarboxylase [Gammaproteobacteria bacterium]
MTTNNNNHRFLAALQRQPTDKTPVWIMRQAGRYLPEYRATRAKAGSFMDLCKNPELACEVTLQPLARFDLDAAILFSDILTIPDAMGLGLNFTTGEGPQFARPVRDAAAVAALPILDPEQDLSYVMDAVRLIRHELAERVPLIGFAGSPWTVATYMVEGGSSKNFSIIKKMRYRDPALLKKLLGKIAQATAAYLNAQIAAGVQAVQIFDTWGGVLTGADYQEFSLDFMQQILQQLTRTVNGQTIPVIFFTKGGGQWLETIASSGCDAVGLDWMTDIGAARRRIGSQVALQGNLDPSVLYAEPKVIQQQVHQVLQAYRDAGSDSTGHVFNLGHGIYPDVPPEHVKVLVDAVHNFK